MVVEAAGQDREQSALATLPAAIESMRASAAIRAPNGKPGTRVRHHLEKTKSAPVVVPAKLVEGSYSIHALFVSATPED
ncbi:hypothetical protein ABZV58_15055 [Nocardia sp. NPDC004654]|uniref:hypothetical protein n=1 Tax=Nocardia sp. NPDC004654 TaxID=3154776 RepID=UPI0033BDF86B